MFLDVDDAGCADRGTDKKGCSRYPPRSAADRSGHLRQISPDTCGRCRNTSAADPGEGAAPPGRGLPDCRSRGLFDYRTVVFAATTGLFLLLVTHTFEGDFGEHFEKKFSGNEANLGFLHH